MDVHMFTIYILHIYCQWLATGWWFSSGTPVSYTNKTDRHDIFEILLKVTLNTITQTPLTPFYSETIRTDMYSWPLSNLNHVYKTCLKKILILILLSTMYRLTAIVQHICHYRFVRTYDNIGNDKEVKSITSPTFIYLQTFEYHHPWQ